MKKMTKLTSKKKSPTDIVKKKMKKKKITYCNSIAKVFHSDVVFEVLARLPVKALDKFKCVSKSWSSIIRQPQFVKAHKPSGSILINFLPIKCSYYNSYHIDSNSIKGIFYASAHGKNVSTILQEVFAHRVTLPYFGYEDITPVLNGLACLYTGHRVSLFNMSTRELMELPSSSVCGEGPGPSVWYALSFDPIDNVYKLLKVSFIAHQKSVYEILTLETSSRLTWRWRQIVQEGLPCFSYVCFQGYFLNGTIYCKFQGPNGQQLLAFDVHQEHFTVVKLPPMSSSIMLEFVLNFSVFGQFEGRLALTHPKSTQFDQTVLDVWALEDHQTSSWSKHKINVPDEPSNYLSEVTIIGNLPSGELLICGHRINSKEYSIFSYDLMKKKLAKLMLELPNSILRGQRGHYRAHITFLMEKMTPLNVLLGLKE